MSEWVGGRAGGGRAGGERASEHVCYRVRMSTSECKSDLPMDHLRCLGRWGLRGFIEPLKPSLQYPVRTPRRGQSVRELSVKNGKLLCYIHKGVTLHLTIFGL